MKILLHKKIEENQVFKATAFEFEDKIIKSTENESKLLTYKKILSEFEIKLGELLKENEKLNEILLLNSKENSENSVNNFLNIL